MPFSGGGLRVTMMTDRQPFWPRRGRRGPACLGRRTLLHRGALWLAGATVGIPAWLRAGAVPSLTVGVRCGWDSDGRPLRRLGSGRYAALSRIRRQGSCGGGSIQASASRFCGGAGRLDRRRAAVAAGDWPSADDRRRVRRGRLPTALCLGQPLRLFVDEAGILGPQCCNTDALCV